jgi:hypothetical protein
MAETKKARSSRATKKPVSETAMFKGFEAKTSEAKTSEGKTSEGKTSEPKVSNLKAGDVKKTALSMARTSRNMASTAATVAVKETGAAVKAIDAAVKLAKKAPASRAPAPKAPTSRAPTSRAPAPAALEAIPPVLADVTTKVVTEAARQATTQIKASRETLRLAITEAATASSHGVLEVNDKMIDAFRAQSDVAIELWRSALSAGSLTEAIRVQADGARQAYETASAQWKDIAETTTRWIDRSVQPIQSVWSSRLV